jgi:protease-4
MRTPTRLALALLALATLTGCIPNTVTLTLGGAGDDLKSSAVITDDGARDQIAMIDVRGMIADSPRAGLVGSQPSVVDDVVRRLQQAESDKAVKAVILRINSPGGTVAGSDMLYRELRRFREATGKPIVVSMGEIATSGGYYVALAGDEIFAEPTTVTGSIGVIFATFNVHDGLSRIGIQTRSITSGPNKAMASPIDPPQEGHYEIMQAMVDEFYESFKALVLERRPTIDETRVSELTDGRVVTGATAAATGLVDHNGGIREAFDRAKSLAGLEKANLIRYYTGRGRPRTPYAETPAPTPTAGANHVNMLEINIGAGPLQDVAVPYFLWLPDAL